MSTRGKTNALIADPSRSASIAKRLWAKVQVGGSAECWLWQAKAKHKFGYGMINAGRDLGVLYAHSLAWALFHGPIPNEAFVLHTCDVPGCCNPAHLYLGDHARNMADVADRKRRAHYKHSAETIAKIKARRAANPPKVSEEGRISRSEAIRKRWKSDEWRQRFSELTSGERNHRFGKRPPAHQIAAALRNVRRGFKHSDATKQKMREAALARRGRSEASP